jgi:intracellular septation protein
MVATSIAVAAAIIRDRRLALFPLFGFSMVMFFGSISLFIHDKHFFILRDTIADLTFGTILLVSLILKRPALRPMFEATFAITKEGWTKLTFRWLILYYVIGFSNEFIRRTHSVPFWVDFKLISVIITILFGLYQFRLTARTRIPGESNKWGLRIASREVKELLAK